MDIRYTLASMARLKWSAVSLRLSESVPKYDLRYRGPRLKQEKWWFKRISIGSMYAIYIYICYIYIYICYIYIYAIYGVSWIPSIYPSHVSINIPAPWIRHGIWGMMGMWWLWWEFYGDLMGMNGWYSDTIWLTYSDLYQFTTWK